MILGRLDHVGVAAPSNGDSIAFYRDVMGTTSIGVAYNPSARIAADAASHYNDM